MAYEVTLIMSEAQKLGVIQETLAGRFTVITVAGILHLSERQLYRLRQCIRSHGPQGIVHENRGHPPSHTLPVAKRVHLVALYQYAYNEYNFIHFTEALKQGEGLVLSDETPLASVGGFGLRYST